MKFFDVISYDKAKQIIQENMPKSLVSTIVLPINSCLGKVVATDIFAQDMLPSYNRSTVDGYALRAEDAFVASDAVPSILKIVGEIKIGDTVNFQLQSGQAVAISTGAMLPQNANAVAMVEHTEKLHDNIAIYQSLKIRENTVFMGEDIAQNDIVVKKGQVLTPMLLGVLAGVGVTEVEVFGTPKVAIISTGDELVPHDKKPIGGQIRDINTTVLAMLCEQSNYKVVSYSLVEDNFDKLYGIVDNASKIADIVLISGGSSVGSEDYTKRVLEKLGKVHIHGIAVKPGKPTMVATINDSIVFGLPGHPLAATLCFKVFVQNAVKILQNQQINADYFITAEENFHAQAGRTNIQPVSIIKSEKQLFARAVYIKSAYIARASTANGYIIIPDNCEGIIKGQKVEVYKL